MGIWLAARRCVSQQQHLWITSTSLSVCLVPMLPPHTPESYCMSRRSRFPDMNQIFTMGELYRLHWLTEMWRLQGLRRHATAGSNHAGGGGGAAEVLQDTSGDVVLICLKCSYSSQRVEMLRNKKNTFGAFHPWNDNQGLQPVPSSCLPLPFTHRRCLRLRAYLWHHAPQARTRKVEEHSIWQSDGETSIRVVGNSIFGVTLWIVDHARMRSERKTDKKKDTKTVVQDVNWFRKERQ